MPSSNLILPVLLAQPCFPRSAAFRSEPGTNRGPKQQVRATQLSRRFRVFLAAQPALAELQDALGDMFGAEAELLH